MSRVPCYPSDLTDAEWELVEPLLPPPGEGGRPEKHPRRDIVDAILYVVRTGCAWRQLPVDFPPWETVYWYFTRWELRFPPGSGHLVSRTAVLLEGCPSCLLVSVGRTRPSTR